MLSPTNVQFLSILNVVIMVRFYGFLLNQTHLNNLHCKSPQKSTAGFQTLFQLVPLAIWWDQVYSLSSIVRHQVMHQSLCSNTKEGLDKIRVLRRSSSMDCTKHKDMGVVQIEIKQTTNDLRQMYALLMAAGQALAI